MGNIQWQKCLGGSLGEDAFSIYQSVDGGYVLVGNTQSNDGDVSGNHGNVDDVWVVKLNSSGIIQWQKCLGGSAYDYATSIQQTTDGGYILTGYTQSNNGDVSGNHGSSPFVDAWVVKLNSLGNLQWQKCLGGTSDDYGYSIIQTTDGGYILASITSSNDGDIIGNHGNEDIWAVKLSSLGNIQWQKCLGGTSGDGGYSIKQITDGGYVIAGQTFSNNGDVSGYHGYGDMWVLKLNSLGNIQWQNCLGGTITERALSFQETTDGGYILAGYTESNNGDVSGNHGNSDAWVVKLSATAGMNDFSSITSLNIFPNPVFDNVTVNLFLSKTENLTLQLKDVLGQTVIEPIYLKNSSGTFSHSISTSKLPNGIYLLDIMGEEGRKTEKIIIEH